MAAGAPSSSDSPAFHGSIRWRAALLTSGLVAAVLATFTWFVVREVRADLARGGAERAETIATLLATQTGQTAQQGLTRFEDLAKDPAVRAVLVAPSAAARRQLADRFHRFGQPNQDQTVEVWDRDGHRVMTTVVGPDPADAVPAAPPPTTTGLGPLEIHEGRLFTRMVADVVSDGLGPPAPIGYVVASHWVRPSPSSAVNGIVGNGATILIGNQSGSIWTNLERVVPPPPVNLAVTGAHEFNSATGDPLIGAAAKVNGTPWIVVIELRRAVVVGPADQLLTQLAVADLAFLIVTMVVGAVLSGQVTRPLVELTAAAQTIAQGDYSRRVVAVRRDEVGQLGQAFNAMAVRVEQARQDLEARAADLDLSRQAADRATRVKDEFLAALSHELRTPLNAMLGWCHMLRGGTVPPERIGHALEVIERNAVAQLRLVEDLLDVSRIVAGKFTLDAQLIDPAAVVAAAVESIHPIALARHVRLDAHVSSSDRVLGDPGRLQQAVWNLLSNAIKFTPRGGQVEVTVRQAGADVEIVVRDTGCGISPAMLPVIFDRLQQGGDDATRRQGGLGLGLAIVRQVVELHRGTVEASSAGADHGATFRILIPVVTVSAVDADRRAPRVLGRPGRSRPPVSVEGLRILVVEDADDARQLLHDFLTSQGATVMAVESAAAALEWLEGHRPDIIVSDIEMPGQSGLDFMRQVRAQRPDLGLIPAIALTAYGAPDDRSRSFASGFQTHLTKPVDLAELVDTVVALCRGTADPVGSVEAHAAS